MVEKDSSSIFFKNAALYILILFSNVVLAKASFSERPAISEYDISQYKNQPAIVLRHEVNVEIEENGQAATQTYVAILLNDETAIQDYSQLDITYNSFNSEMNIDFARVHNDGHVQYLKDDAITRQNMSTETYLFDNERILFSLPSLKPGAIIELQYTNTNLRAVIPGNYNALKNMYWMEGKAGGSSRADRVVTSVLNIKYPEEISLDWRQSDLINVQPTVEKGDDHITMRWQVSDLHALKNESYIPEDMNLFPLIYVSTLKSWQQINQWAYQKFSEQISQNDEIKRIADNILQKANTDEDRIRAVFDFMEKNVRYVYAHVGRDGYEPHPASEVLENSYGDCKDQTVLTISILRAMGIEAYPALVSSSMSKIAADLPRNYFDHVFVYIPPSESRAEIWMDTTGETLDFPGIHWSLENKPALILNNVNDQLTTVVSTENQVHKADVTLSFMMINQFDVEINMAVRYSGLLGQNISNMKTFSEDQDAFVRKMLSPIYPKAELLKTDLVKIEDAIDTFELRAVFIAKDVRKGGSEPLNVGVGLHQFVGLIFSFDSLDQPDKRVFPFSLDQAYVLSMDATLKNPGEGYAPVVVNSGTNYASRYFDIQQNSLLTESSNLQIKASLNSREVLIPVNEYESFYRAAKDIQNLPGWFVSYQQDNRTLALSKAKAAIMSDNLEEMLSNVEIYLSNGAFSDALKFADRAIELDAFSAKAHYLRGVALGYQQQYDASNQAFEKAMELGYEL